jgi:low temperature requirement protein LtrA
MWIYTHIPVTIGVAATGAALLNVVEHAEDSLPYDVRWLLVGAVATALIGIVALIRSLQSRRAVPQMYAAGQIAIVFSAIGTLALGSSSLETIPLLLALIALLLLPIWFALAFWLRSLDAGDVPAGLDPVSQSADAS